MNLRRLFPLFCLAALSVTPTAGYAQAPSDEAVRAAFRPFWVEQYMGIWGMQNRKMQFVARMFGQVEPETPAEKTESDQVRRESAAIIAKEKIFVGDKISQGDGTYLAVVSVGSASPSQVYLMRGPNGWFVKCYIAQNNSKQCY